MAAYPEITSSAQLQLLLKSNKLTIITCYRAANEKIDVLESAAGRISDKIQLARCDLRKNQWAETLYHITVDPTFLAFKPGAPVIRMSGVDELLSSIPDLFEEYLDDPKASGSSSQSGSSWIGAAIPKNYSNVAANIETKGLDLMNSDTTLGSPAILFDDSKPSGLNPKAKTAIKDWVESDTDEQLMLFIPFKSAVKLHSIHITSLPPACDEDDEAPSRPKTVKLFRNTHQILGFEEAEERAATQIVEFKPDDWNKDGSTVLLTKFVNFQSCSTLTIFFQDVEKDGCEKVRIDRVRMIGEVTCGEVDMAKLKQQEE